MAVSRGHKGPEELSRRDGVTQSSGVGTLADMWNRNRRSAGFAERCLNGNAEMKSRVQGVDKN
jgi:hypothetical protein